jgi:hypothetical protein
VVRAMFAHRNWRKPWVTTPEIELAFVCEHKLVIDLVRAEELKKMPGTDISAGKGNATQIQWESITNFLTRRKTGAKTI